MGKSGKVAEMEQEKDRQGEPRGQIIVILAGGMVAFLLIAGLAVDGGFLLMRQAQLERAVDASALSGITQMALNPTGPSGACANCDAVAHEFLAVNGVTLIEEADFQSELSLADLPGGYRYHIEVDWASEVFFMRIAGFDNIPLHAQATAEYYPMMDMYADPTGPDGVIRDTLLAVLGPNNCSGNGDPVSPTGGPWHNWVDPAGSYTFRIGIPDDYPYDSVRVEIFDPDSYNYPNDPETIGHPAGPPTDDFSPCDGPDQDDEGESCLIETEDTNNPYWFVRADRYYSGCAAAPGGSSDTQTRYRLFYLRQNTSGRLNVRDLAYYTTDAADAADAAEGASTDLRWISPVSADNADSEPMPLIGWGPYNNDDPDNRHAFTAEPVISPDDCATCSGDGDFIVNLADDAPDIYVDPDSGTRHLYIQVQTQGGDDENGFQIWAGPPREGYNEMEVDEHGRYRAFPSNGNSRNIYVIGSGRLRDSAGVVVTGLGYLPMRSNIDSTDTNHGFDPLDHWLAYLPREFGDQTAQVQLFDLDGHDRTSDAQPIYFHFDPTSMILLTDLAMCYGEVQNNPPSPDCRFPGNLQLLPGTASNLPSSNTAAYYELPVPADILIYEDPVNPGYMPFEGGSLMVDYIPRQFDLYTWRMTTFSRPFLSFQD